jgi:hypothetical protein
MKDYIIKYNVRSGTDNSISGFSKLLNRDGNQCYPVNTCSIKCTHQCRCKPFIVSSTLSFKSSGKQTGDPLYAPLLPSATTIRPKQLCPIGHHMSSIVMKLLHGAQTTPSPQPRQPQIFPAHTFFGPKFLAGFSIHICPFGHESIPQSSCLVLITQA